MGSRWCGLQGRRAERKTRHVTEVGRKILQEAELGSRCPGQEGGRAEGKVSEVWWLFLVS